MRETIERVPAAGLGALTMVVASGLCLVVLAVGAVALLAEAQNTWGWYFLMEETVAFATPVATALLGLTVVLAIGTVARAS